MFGGSVDDDDPDDVNHSRLFPSFPSSVTFRSSFPRQALRYISLNHSRTPTRLLRRMEERLQKSVEGLIDQVDRRSLRPMRKAGFECSARCCDSAGSHEDLNSCVQKCQERMYAAETVLGAELEAFQGRLQRCAMGCQDAVQERLGVSPTQAQVEAVRPQLESCANKCVDDHIATLPAMKKRVEDSLSKLGR